MKKFLCATALLSILLTPLSSEGDEVNPNADPRPCRIMVEQIKAFLKKDPQKGYSAPYTTDLSHYGPDEDFLFRRALAAGVGMAVMLRPTILIGGAGINFSHYLDQKKMRVSSEVLENYGIKDSSDLFSGYPDRVIFDLSESSGYLVAAVLGGSSYCIHNYTFKVVQKEGYRELQDSGPQFHEGELCRPSDFTIIRIADKEYTLVNNTTLTGDWEEGLHKKGGFIFDIHLYPMGFIKDYSYSYDDPKEYKSTCKIKARFEAVDGNGGVLKKVSSYP